jgi:hypothetical protein
MPCSAKEQYMLTGSNSKKAFDNGLNANGLAKQAAYHQ